MRENHGPRKVWIGHAPPELTVDEIADPSGGEPKRNQRRNEIGDIQPRPPALAYIPAHGQQHAEKASVERHSALPDRKNFQRMLQVVGRLVEQHLPHTTAGDDTDYPVKKQIIELGHGPTRLSPTGMRQDAPATQPPELQECRQVHQSVPAYSERADLERDRINLRVNQHG